MINWKKQLDNYNSLLRELTEKQLVQKENKSGNVDGALRFNRFSVIASDVASQYYCEKKVELQYLHGEVETPEMIAGTEAHEKLLEDSVVIEREALWQEIYGDKPVYALEMLLLARYRDIVLVGKPDSVLFCKGQPRMIFEYKFSRSNRAYISHHAQARTYGILLESMGFDTNDLFYTIVIASPQTKGDAKLRQDVLNAVNQNGYKEAIIPIENATIYTCKFDSANAQENLDWAIQYWTHKREALQTDNPNKCLKCEYAKECPKAASTTPKQAFTPWPNARTRARRRYSVYSPGYSGINWQ